MSFTTMVFVKQFCSQMSLKNHSGKVPGLQICHLGMQRDSRTRNTRVSLTWPNSLGSHTRKQVLPTNCWGSGEMRHHYEMTQSSWKRNVLSLPVVISNDTRKSIAQHSRTGCAAHAFVFLLTLTSPVPAGIATASPALSLWAGRSVEVVVHSQGLWAREKHLTPVLAAHDTWA